MRSACAAAICAGLIAAVPAAARGAKSATRPAAAAPRSLGYHFLAGAGRVDTTPPLAGTAAAAQANQQFAPGFSSCLSGAYPSVGRFALQEPFSDLNGDGQWDDGHGKLPDPYCDANGNGHWDGIYADNGFGPATGIHDPIEVRAVAISDGRDPPVVYASVDQIGVFDYYTDQVRADLANRYGVRAELVVTANHNESSPDSIGLYGAGQTPAGVGIRSGIDEYFMDYLDDRIAQAAAIAVHSLRPARLFANQVQSRIPVGAAGSHYPLLTGLSERISDQFPTSVALPSDNRLAAVDPKMGVLQARSQAGGRPIFTAVSIAAHNQEMGNSGAGLSADWPGAMEHYLDSHHGGLGVFLVADNGSLEDPQTNPPVIRNGSENHTNQATQFIQARATGERFARIAARAAAAGVALEPGPVSLTREQFCVPLENNGFVALAAAGVFGRRQGYMCNARGNPVSPVSATGATQFRTFVSYADIGPDLQLIDNPGEAFPALMVGSPFGADQASCDRPNPQVPTWHARALFRFHVGLADDLIGYLIPAWGFASGTPGLFSGDSCYQDMRGHRHKLESESVGPTGSNDVANRLASLLDREPDPTAHVVQGRFVLANGSYSRWPTSAVGISTQVAPVLVGAPRVVGFGRRRVRLHGVFMDYDGQPQGVPDLTTRGMMLLDSHGCVRTRYYLDVFRALGGMPRLGRVVIGRRVLPRRGCRFKSLHGVAELQPGPARAAGIPVGPG